MDRCDSTVDCRPPASPAGGLRLSSSVQPPIDVGLFDSGVGGLSVVRHLFEQGAPFHLGYLADQAHAPYGGHDLEQIGRWSEGIADWFVDGGAKVVVLACNSASAAALYSLRARHPKTLFVGMEPAVKPAAEHSRNHRIGVIATAATLRGTPFRQVVERFAGGHVVVSRACPELVQLVEQGLSDPETCEQLLRASLAEVVAAKVDQLVLGCTHFAFLHQQIQRIVGDDVQVIDPAAAVARQTLRRVEAAGLSPRSNPTRHFFTTGLPERFQRQIDQLLAGNFAVHPASWQ